MTVNAKDQILNNLTGKTIPSRIFGLENQIK